MHLLVVVEDRISDWMTKGEILDGYFNPGAAFEKVTVLGLVADQPDDGTVARLCAPARHRYIPVGLDRRHLALATVGLRYGLLSLSLRRLASELTNDPPHVMRAYGDGLAAIATSIIADQTGIPFAVSLHTTPDALIQSQYLETRDRVWRRLAKFSGARALRNANAVIAVYSPIVDFLPPDISSKTWVIPNVVGIKGAPKAQDCETSPLRAIWVSRQMPGRDPRPVIAALRDVPEAILTLVGDGPLHESARKTVLEYGLGDRVEVMRAVENDRLCSLMPNFDVMLVNSCFREMPKSVMEASLSGVPVIINRSPAEDTKEYSGIPVVYVDGDARSYASALRALVTDTSRRQTLAQQTRESAWQLWDPAVAGSAAGDLLLNLANGGQ
ncbi:MAG: glycosyltransferase [Alphaproteobacteria bacterium]|nr:glycosyltransferase [Alphaproteobacteria bacterium]